MKLVEPEVVATSPYRIKSPVPVYCGIGSSKLVGMKAMGFPKPCESVSLQETFASRKAMHPQGCQILSLDPLLFGFNHMPVNWHSRQESHLQHPRSKRGALIIEPREQIGRSRW